MKNQFIFSFLLLFSIADAQKFEWVTQAHTAAANNYNCPLAVDDAGNSYAPVFTTAFSPVIIQGDTFPTLGGSAQGTCIVKLDPNGNLIWGTVFSSGNSVVRDIAVDDAGAVFISVIMDGPTTFNTDTTYSNPANRQIIKLNSNGRFLKNIFMSFTPTGGSWIEYLDNALYVADYSTLMKLDTALNTVWSKSTPNGDINFNVYQHTSLFVSNNTILVSGREGGTGNVAPFGQDTIHFSPPHSNEKMLIRLDTAGNMLWEYSFSDLISLNGSGEDSQGNIYVGVTNLNGPYYFGDDTLFNAIGPGNSYSAVFKWDAAGNPVNAVPVYTANNVPTIYDLEINAADEVVFTMNAYLAYIENMLLPWNEVLIKLDPSGNLIWYKTSPGIGSVIMDGLEVRNGNEYLVAGFFHSATSFGCLQFSDPPLNSNYVALISEQQEPVPQTSFSITQQGSTVLFIDETINATSLSWNFGDASSSGLSQPVHTYSQPGIYNACLTASNSCGSSQLCMNIEVKGIRSIDADEGSNDGVMTADIFGGGFTPSATVLLKKTGSGDIIPYFTQYINNSQLRIRLDLSGQITGEYDVEVTVPGDTVMTLVNGFTVVPAAGYEFDITSPVGAAKPGGYIPTPVTVYNKSDKDAVGVMVYYRLDDSWDYYINQQFSNPQQVSYLNAGYQYLVSNGISTTLTDHNFGDTTSDSRFGAFMIPFIKAGSSYNLPLYIKGNISITAPKIAAMSGTLLESSSLAGNYAPVADNCFSAFFKLSVERALSITISQVEWDACFPAYFDSVRQMTSLLANSNNAHSIPVSMPAVVVSMLSSMATAGCITTLPSVITELQMKSVILKTLKVIADSTEYAERMAVCPMLTPLREVSATSQSMITAKEEAVIKFISCVGGLLYWSPLVATAATSPPVAIGIGAAIVLGCFIFSTSVDPNAIYGPGDNSSDIWQRPSDKSAYYISFENADTATASAQVVIIRDTLDATKFNLSTFRFTDVTIGDSLKFSFDDPGFEQIRLSSLSPFSSDYLRTVATFDSSTGVIQWVFNTVDAVDYQPVTDPLAGFLPPNLNGTEGTGHVGYNVELKSSLVTGDSITNRAEIIFDTNAPIYTNDWLNAIDIDDPQSAVNALPVNTNTNSFTLFWSGSDFISGIRYYDIYVSENDNPYVLWLTADSTQAVFTGVSGNKYEFISIATDAAGNREEPPANPETNPDAVTTVITGIEDLKGTIDFHFKPNPVRSQLYIESKEPFNSIIVYDVAGHVIVNKMLAPVFNTILEAEFSDGVYFIEVRSENEFGRARFVKQE